MAGRRWRNGVTDAVSKSLLFYDHTATAAAKPIVLLGGPANTYGHYIATQEEYSIQRYEGASTLFGPNTLNAYIHLTTSNLKYLSANNVESIPRGPEAPDNTNQAWTLIANVPTDRTSSTRPFGKVIRSPLFRYRRGDVANAVFVGACPRNNFRLENSYAIVQRLRATRSAPETSVPDSHASPNNSTPTSPLPIDNQGGSHPAPLPLPQRPTSASNS